MEYGTGGVEGDGGTGAATRRNTSGVADVGDWGASATTGAERAGAIVEVDSVERRTSRDDASADAATADALTAWCLRAMLTGIDVCLVTGFCVECEGCRVTAGSTCRITTAGTGVDAAARATETGARFSAP
jgi:hypothetical protein